MPLLVNRRTILTGMAAFGWAPRPAWAAPVHAIQMLNRHPDDPKRRNVFLPLILSVEPGDTVVFVPTDRGHNATSTVGMIPDGVEAWRSRLSARFSVTLQKPGVYGYHCTPHAALGMVGLIIVRGEGMTANLEAAKAVRQRGRARMVWEEIWERVEAENLLS